MTDTSPPADAEANASHRQPLPRDAAFARARHDYGAQIARCAASYEIDPAKRRELHQEMLLGLWQSLATFKGQCSLRTWVCRVTHNVGVTHIQRERRRLPTVSLDDELPDRETAIESEFASSDAGTLGVERNIDLQRVLRLIDALGAPDRQIMVLYLEAFDASEIAEVVGLSAGNITSKIHRIKALLARQLSPAKERP